jgi:hypothetical protein
MGAIPDSSREVVFVLLIGDDPAMTKIFNESFNKQLPKKWHFRIVSDFEESLKEIDNHNYNFIFLL